MNEIEKLKAEDDLTSFSDLPEDIVFPNFKQAISYTCFTDPYADPSYPASFWSAIESLMKFERVKSLLCLKKEFNGNEIAHQEGEDMALTVKIKMLKICLRDMVYRINLFSRIIHLPMLEKVSIGDSRKRGKVSVSGRKVAEVRNWLSSTSDETTAQKLKYVHTGCRVSECYVPLLELPVSGYVMKEVKLYVLQSNDPADDANVSFMKSDNDDAFEDKEETVYSEALMEIFKKHSDRIVRRRL
ncbi:F-box domain, Leucine-rich repeat domain, L domain-like protein [Artemisia annua]|uniref:F-box domain, Leucine-rich repeat domain, L domain-like protein n=1 Tax=Artemisia annua TaxID=35608 RepID=A0A2U1NZC1_ARTAN|nr:F-box domain, Leucine-rich repeat domain, L domain-like protein [Artemisia annua]